MTSLSIVALSLSSGVSANRPKRSGGREFNRGRTDRRRGPIGDIQFRFFPTVFVLDAKGVIRYKHLRRQGVAEAIDTLLTEPPRKK